MASLVSSPAPSSQRLHANLICMASMLVWAAALPAADFLIGRIPPVPLTALRMSLAGLVLLPVWWLLEGTQALRQADWLKGTAIGAMLALGALFLVMAQDLTDAVTVAVVSSLLPLVGMGLEVAFEGRRMTRALVLGIALSLFGGVLAYAARLDEFGLGLGALIAFGSTAVYAVASRQSVTAFPLMTPLGRSTVTLVGAGIAASLVALAQLATGTGGTWGEVGWTQVAAMALFSIGGMAVSQLLWIVSVGRLGIGVSSLHINAAAFYVMIFAWLLGGTWSWMQAGGALIVGVGVLIAQGILRVGGDHAKA